MRKKYIIIFVTIIILLIFGRFIYTSLGNYFMTKARGQKAVPDVSVQKVRQDDIIRSFEASGRIVSKYQVSIIARVSGYLQKSFFKEGSYVKAGDVLFLIEPDEYRSGAEIAGADINKIKAQLAYANKQLIRAQELVKDDYIAKSKYDEILAERDALDAQLKAAKSNYDDKKRNLSYTSIKAPVNGRIGIIDVTEGNYVGPSSGSLTTINSTNPIYVTFPISASDYHALQSIDKEDYCKRKVDLFFTSGEKYNLTGVQDFIDNEVDQTTGTVTFRATFQNPDNRLMHGQFVKVKIYANNPVKVPLVPMTAVQENQEGKYVYVLNNENLPELRYIKTESQAGYNWIVKSGLKVGETVITDGVLKVTPNKPVHIVDKINK